MKRWHTPPVSRNAQEMYNEFQYGDFNYSREKHAPFLLKFIERIYPGAKVFDIGCGTGYWLDVYVRKGIAKKNIVGIDLAPNNVERLKRRGFHAQQGDILHLPLEKNISDFTICDSVLHHCDNPFQGFAELVRITKSGGYIFLNVYNKWHPYFYVVYKSTFPIRYLYWNWNKSIINLFYPIVKLILQPISKLITGKFLDDKTAKTLFLDQIITPRAYLFSKKMIHDYAKKTGCEVEGFAYNRYYLMLSAILIKK